ncbi:MAG TPA: saccharopine dehydrogenase NADP-binding domain-containing protein [Ornithinimicrobium sp.]|uniref:saccharopine dehydrogenase family protein n=1 Tax=Ornithinimicrobium sp. TaxID=1977084 RepID=UPI002B4819CC|nr:saccharopine dehydrogenase NADP-binding domain-containing protein [Ornithinimicrobium sp.]HKJ11535.1 saccharopine dehydrogenase NADP-binding domain-containing protein [Ornithinimicrobium sp.]
MSTSRDLDLVLVGATGFVGRLTAAYLAASAPSGVRIGLAARSGDRLDRLVAQLPDHAASWPRVTVDATDASQVTDLVRRTRAVATTVGPYDRYGHELVAACAAAGTHYADLTGEVLFVRKVIQRHHRRAQDTGAVIVPSCGFDSVPSDLAVLLAADAAREDGEGRLVEATLHVRDARGGMGGGTIDTLRGQVAAMHADPAARRVVGDPDALAEARTAYGRGPRPIGKDTDSGRWHGPFFMSPYNTRVVRRSWSLTEGAAPLVYEEVADTTTGWRGAATAAGIGLGTGALAAVMAFPVTRGLADRVLPSPGEGPSERTRAAGRFAFEVDAVTTTDARYRSRVAARLDPGFDATAVMLGESGLALASGEAVQAGVLTPATALGQTLPDRLRSHGFTVEVTRQ